MKGRWIRRLLLVSVVVIAAAGGWWAGRQTLVATDPTSAPSQDRVVISVEEATIGRELVLNATVVQPHVVLAENALSGIVTWVTGEEVFDTGAAVYSVADVPVRVVEGDLPFYRDLELGSSGTDVAQLQAALSSAGVYDGEADGRFDAGVRTALREWQRSNGDDITGVAVSGTLIAVPSLPAAVSVGEDIVKGTRLEGGEVAVNGASGERRFVLTIGSEQERLIPPDATVDVTYDVHTWPSVLGERTTNDNGETEITLTSPEGAAVCGQSCAELPSDEHVSLRALVHIVPATTGPAVPAAAVRTTASGGTYVLTEGGESRPVTVVASGDGMAIVDGVTAGARIVVLDPNGAPQGQADDSSTGETGDEPAHTDVPTDEATDAGG